MLIDIVVFMDFLLILFLAVILFAWWDNLRSKEAARRAGKATCIRQGYQFLDDTVQVKKIWLRRSSRGNLQFCRLYLFEYSVDGLERCKGKIKLCGQVVYKVELEEYSIYEQ